MTNKAYGTDYDEGDMSVLIINAYCQGYTSGVADAQHDNPGAERLRTLMMNYAVHNKDLKEQSFGEVSRLIDRVVDTHYPT